MGDSIRVNMPIKRTPMLALNRFTHPFNPFTCDNGRLGARWCHETCRPQNSFERAL